jgi:hypothetical protein
VIHWLLCHRAYTCTRADRGRYEHADGLVGVYREQEENSSRTLTLDLRKVSSESISSGVWGRWRYSDADGSEKGGSVRWEADLSSMAISRV